MFQFGTRLQDAIMSENKEPIIITRKKYHEVFEKYQTISKKYDEIQKQYDGLKMSMLDEQRLSRENAEEIGYLRGNMDSIMEYYDDLAGQQFSMVLDVLNDNNVDYFYRLMAPIDYDGDCLWKTCYELLHIDPGSIFLAEENMGWFETMSNQNLVHWAEIAAFHTISWKQSGMWELYDGSSFDASMEEEYGTYKMNLHYGTLQKIISEFPKLHRNYLSSIDEERLSMRPFYRLVNGVCRELSAACAQIFRHDDIETHDQHSAENTGLHLIDDLADDEEVEL